MRCRGLGEMLDRGHQKTQETGPTFAGQTGDESPEGKPRTVGIVAIASSRPSSDTLYRTTADSHPVVPAAQAI